MVLENAYWRPQAAKLHGKHKDSLGAVTAPEAEKGYQKARIAWAREETWINYSLNALFMGMPSELVRLVIAQFTGGFQLMDPQVASLGSGGLSALTGDPDLILVDGPRCVLIESKVAAHPKSHRYSFEQLTKYMTLAKMCELASRGDRPRSFVHLIVAPSLDPKVFCGDAEQWEPSVESGELTVDPIRVRPADRFERFHDFPSWRRWLVGALASRKVQARCGVDEALLRKVESCSTPLLAPTWVVTWDELLGGVVSRCREQGLNGHAEAADQLLALALGRPSVHMIPD